MRVNTAHHNPSRLRGRDTLTDRQREIVKVISAFWLAHGYAPTLRELCALTGIRSTNGVSDHLRLIAKKGFVSWERLKVRTLRVIREVGA